MHDCILVEGTGRCKLVRIEEGRQEVTIANPGSGHYFGFRVREYSIEKEGHLKVYLIASEDLQDQDEVEELVREFNPSPIDSHSV
ncbi:hypothetical protein V1572_13660 [Enterobacter quasiroggenkampii]|uniref:hypothetical protein n=1 Tax=Enterobacter quasiroggenkampii TaxID=2497436 RepID=UPI0037548F00